MKLYDVPANSKVRVVEEGADDEVYNFHNIDGMYSYCTDSKGNVVHLVAWTEVEIVE
jgi:hypothetical protein